MKAKADEIEKLQASVKDQKSELNQREIAFEEVNSKLELSSKDINKLTVVKAALDLQVSQGQKSMEE